MITTIAQKWEKLRLRYRVNRARVRLVSELVLVVDISRSGAIGKLPPVL